MRLPAACTDALATHLQPAVFRALSDPRRLSLIAELAIRPDAMTVSEASDCCDVHVSGVSRHLSVLKQAGIVHAEKNGREVRYRLDAPALTALLRGLADAIEQCCAAAGCCSPPKPQNRRKGTRP